MTMMAPALVAPELVRVEEGRIHLRYRLDDRWVKDERCNLGQVKLLPATLADLENADPDELCNYCFDK